MCGATARVQVNTPFKLTEITASNCSSLITPDSTPSLYLMSWPSRRMPPLLTRTYTAPSRAATSSTAPSTEAVLATSTFWKMPPSCASPSFTSQEATRQPSCAKRRAAARPMPAAPPVTTTTLSFNPVSIIYNFPQMSPTLKPSANGSSGSTTYWANPVIQACPESAGTTAAYAPTRVSSSRRPVNVVPRMPSWTKSSYSPRCPLACSAAILAHVSVPQGEDRKSTRLNSSHT